MLMVDMNYVFRTWEGIEHKEFYDQFDKFRIAIGHK